jgi:hypothetical protein
MSEQMTATIIPFPRVKAAAEADPQVRLRRALAALDLAVAEQRAAVAKWRASLGELRGSVHGLGQSVGEYHQRLGTLADDVMALHRQARRMETWADRRLGCDAQP